MVADLGIGTPGASGDDPVPAASDSTAGPPSRRDRRRAAWSGRWSSIRGAGGLRILAAAGGGFVLNLAFAPKTWWWAAILGLALLGLAVHGRRLRPALGLGLVFGLAFYVPLLSWTTVYVGGVALALSIAEALLTAPAVALIAAASRRLPAAIWPWAAAAAWLAGEALRARFPFGGFPWGAVAFSQADGPLLPVASLLGSAGLGFLTAAAGFGLAAALRLLVGARREGRRVLRPTLAVGAATALVLPFVGGLVGLGTRQLGADAPRAEVAVVQGNVPEPGLEFNARRKAVTDMHAAQTAVLAEQVRAGERPAPVMVIWPENSSDIDPYRNPDAYATIHQAVVDIGVPTLVGAVVTPTPPEGTVGKAPTWNMGIVWDPETGPGQTYSKRHPVPFAEYMPFRDFFRIFTHWVDSAGNFQAGTEVGNLDIAGINVGDVICFEVVYDHLVRDVVEGGAEFLVVQTNNATFGYTNETYQQMAMSRVRAVEFGRQVIVSATSGVSGVIRPDGSVEQTVGLFVPGLMSTAVPLIEATTPGTVLGAPVEWALTGAILLALAVATAGQVVASRRITKEQL